MNRPSIRQVTIKSIRALDCTGSGSLSNIYSAMDYVYQNQPSGQPAVVSMSLGGGEFQIAMFESSLIYNLVKNKNIVVAVAAGNNGVPSCWTAPAFAEDALTVGSIDPTNNQLSSFSDWGRCTDVAAPGEYVCSSIATSTTAYEELQGTSMATPMVSGAATLILQENPS